MTLSAGDSLGPYEIVEPIGKGGMGAVYRARDTRLGRDVAIKISDQQFGERFEREARVISSLNHPNICSLFDVGPDFLVMELVEGETLADRIALGPIPLEESLHIARQIADALEAAHDKGIVHRDLKPGNVIVKADGTVKVLDFGLAKVGPRTASGEPETDNSPTISMAATQAGVILGTAAYMAPEQARGKTVDKRADIWAFGVVLHEMVTGQKLFKGEDLTDTLAAVVKIDPDLSGVPPELQPLLKRCVEKDPRKRLRDISGVELLLEAGRAATAAPSVAEHGAGHTRLVWPAIAAFSLLIAAMSVWAPWRSAPAATATDARFTIEPPPGGQSFAAGSSFAVAPDGTSIAFVTSTGSGTTTETSLWVRELDSFTARALDRTAGARSPFWSPDSKFIAFVADGKLKRIAVDGGAPIDITGTLPGVTFRSTVTGAWRLEPDSESDGVILLAVGSAGMGIHQVPASGGDPVPVTEAESAERHLFAEFLPGGGRFLYSVSGGDEPGLYVQTPGASDRTRLSGLTGKVAFAPPDFLLYVQNGTLLAQRWNWAELVPVGAPVSVADGMDADAFSVSGSGLLAYASVGSGDARFEWFDREGRRVGPDLPLDPDVYSAVHLAPDDRRAVVTRGGGQENELWLLELDSENPVATRLAAGAFPAWSPDSRRIVYTRREDGEDPGIYQMVIGSGRSTLLYSRPDDAWPQLSWHGNDLVLSGNPVSVLPAPGEDPVAPMVEQAREVTGLQGGPVRVSPDGRWVAYVARPANTWELWVAGYPDFTNRRKVADGVGPRWRGDSRELFFVSEREGLMSVDVAPAPTFEHTAPKFLMNPPGTVINGPSFYDVTSDGQRFLLEVRDLTGSQVVPMSIVLKWQSLLDRQ